MPMPKLAANLSMLFPELAVPRALRRRGAGRVPRASSTSIPYRVAAATTSRRRRATPASRWCCTTCRRATRSAASAASPACPGASSDFRDDVERAIEYAQRGALPAPAPAGGRGPAPARSAPRCTLPTSRTCKLRRAQRSAREGMRAADRADQRRAPCPTSSCARARRRRRCWTTSARATPSCSTTSSTCRSWKATSRATIERLLPRIGHMQLADVPGRNEPGTRRDQLRLPAAPHRRARLLGLDRLRIQSQG